MLLPRIEKVIEEHNGSVNLAKVDIDDNAEIAMEYGLSRSLIYNSTWKISKDPFFLQLYFKSTIICSNFHSSS